MTTYASKEWIFWRLDSLISHYNKGSIDLDILKEAGFEELFDGDQAPHVEFYGLRHEHGKLVAAVAPPEGEDADEWCAALQDFVGDRFEVEPTEPRPTSSIRSYGTPVPFVIDPSWLKHIEEDRVGSAKIGEAF